MNLRKVRDIEYQILPGTERKTTDIVIERDGLVNVRPPRHFSAEQVDAVVESKRMWIYKNLAEWRDMNAARVIREWVNGEGFLYLGSSYRLLLVAEQDEPLKLKNGRFCLRRDIIDQGGEQAAKVVFERFFVDKGLERIQYRVDYFAAKVGVMPLSVTVRDLGYRWGSCSKDGKLAFHWKCMMALRPRSSTISLCMSFAICIIEITPTLFGMKWIRCCRITGKKGKSTEQWGKV